jgi:hypothetical protein
MISFEVLFFFKAFIPFAYSGLNPPVVGDPGGVNSPRLMLKYNLQSLLYKNWLKKVVRQPLCIF